MHAFQHIKGRQRLQSHAFHEHYLESYHPWTPRNVEVLKMQAFWYTKNNGAPLALLVCLPVLRPLQLHASLIRDTVYQSARSRLFPLVEGIMILLITWYFSYISCYSSFIANGNHHKSKRCELPRPEKHNLSLGHTAQVEGVEFMWQRVVLGQEGKRVDADGRGCILAHR